MLQINCPHISKTGRVLITAVPVPSVNALGMMSRLIDDRHWKDYQFLFGLKEVAMDEHVIDERP